MQRDLALGKSVVILGSRRVGKTTLAKMLGENASVYITFDDVDYQSLVRQSPKNLLDICDRNKLNILDEVQKAPEVFDTVKLLIDDGYLFLLTGSSSLHLLENVAETLAGRIRIRRLEPCAWGEDRAPFSGGSVLFGQGEHPNLHLLLEAKRELEKAIQFGGYPELVGKTNDEKQDLLRDYRNTYLQRDILELANVHDLNGFRALCMALAVSTGSTVSYQNLASESGLSHVTVKKYLHALEQTSIVFQIHPYQFGSAKRYIKASKWYFSDMGLLWSLKVRLSEGQVFENFVISEIRKRLILANMDENSIYFYRTQAGAEIDLIVDTQDRVFAYEIKNSSTFQRKHIRNLSRFSDGNKTGKALLPMVIYKGETVEQIDAVKFVPVFALYQRP